MLSLAQIPESPDLQLDLGNTYRALSDRAWDLYWRSGEAPDLQDAIKNARAALQNYTTVASAAGQSVAGRSVAPLAPETITLAQQQAELNQLSLLLAQQRELDCLQDSTHQGCRFEKQQQRIKNQSKLAGQLWSSEIQNQLNRFLSGSDPSHSLSALLAQIEQLPVDHTTLQLRLNLAQILIDLPTFKNLPSRHKFSMAEHSGNPG